jgi:hypothetical protein
MSRPSNWNTRLCRVAANLASGERVNALIPPPLPPDPPLVLDGLLDLQDHANRALGRLDGVTSILPNTDLFLYMWTPRRTA